MLVLGIVSSLIYSATGAAKPAGVCCCPPGEAWRGGKRGEAGEAGSVERRERREA